MNEKNAYQYIPVPVCTSFEKKPQKLLVAMKMEAWRDFVA